MSTTIAALFDDVAEAHSAAYTLVQHGVDRYNIHLLSQETDEETVNYIKEGYVPRTGFKMLQQGGEIEEPEWAKEEADDDRRIQAGFSDEASQYYREEIRRGGTLLLAEIGNRGIDEMRSLLQSHNPVRTETWNASRRGREASAISHVQEQAHQDNVVNRPPLSEDRREPEELNQRR